MPTVPDVNRSNAENLNVSARYAELSDPSKELHGRNTDLFNETFSTRKSPLIISSRTPVLIVDVEATCWEHRSSDQRNEIIEIGFAIVHNQSVIHSNSWFVRPLLNPKLSEFCRRLTCITQEMVDAAPLFPEALELFKADVEANSGEQFRNLPFLSWGYYDQRQFSNDCALHNITYPFAEHMNLKECFKEKYGVKKPGILKALKILNLEFQGTHHRGVDDALNIANVFIKAFDEP